MKMNMDTYGLAVAGQIGTWHTIDHIEVDGHTFWLMEHDTYGDEVACIIVDDDGKLSLTNVYDGFDEHTVDLLRQEVMPVEIMPDYSITVAEMKEYGYGWGGMLPMREDAAVEVMKYCTVYRLYCDDSEEIVMDVNDIKAHAAQEGIFGVKKIEWQSVLTEDEGCVINGYGQKIDFDMAVEIMVDELREHLAYEMYPCTAQEFFDAYCAAHEKEYGEEFECAKKNPCY